MINNGCKLLRENQRKLLVGHAWLCQKASPYNARCWCHLELLGATRHPKHWQKRDFCDWIKPSSLPPSNVLKDIFWTQCKSLYCPGENELHTDFNTRHVFWGSIESIFSRAHLYHERYWSRWFQQMLEPMQPMLLLCISHYFNRMRIQPCWFLAVLITKPSELRIKQVTWGNVS